VARPLKRTFERFLEPPRLRTLRADDEEDRRATWLELFFDLVFVAAVAQASFLLTDHLVVSRLFGYLGIFVAIWWAWMGFTFYANRFDTDDLVYRMLVLLAMLAIAALAVNTRHALSGSSEGFAVSYIAVRLVLLTLYARARRHVEAARRLTTIFLTMFGAAVVVWCASLLVEPPARYWLWGCALVIELSAPLFAWRALPNAPIHPRHIPERFGLLVIIVLGESVFAVVVGTADVSWHTATVVAAVAGFVAAASLWWIYFEFLDESVVQRGRGAGLTFTYSNYLVISGLALLGTGVKLAILSTGSQTRYAHVGWVLGAGAVLTMVGLAIVQLATPPTLFDVDVWLRLGTAALALVLAFAYHVLSPVVVVVVLSVALVLQLVYELVEHEGHHAVAAE
jgi:low temperature requirement protein LtrA